MVGWGQVALNQGPEHRAGAQHLVKGESHVWPNSADVLFMAGHQEPVLRHLILGSPMMCCSDLYMSI